jgi:hypothetical protein
MNIEMQIDEWRKLLASVPAEARLDSFRQAARDLARRIGNGVDKATIVDALRDMALCHGFFGLGELECEAIVGDEIAHVPRSNGSGGRAHAISATLSHHPTARLALRPPLHPPVPVLHNRAGRVGEVLTAHRRAPRHDQRQGATRHQTRRPAARLVLEWRRSAR